MKKVPNVVCTTGRVDAIPSGETRRFWPIKVLAWPALPNRTSPTHAERKTARVARRAGK